MKRQNPIFRILGGLRFPLLMIVALTFFLTALFRLDAGQEEESRSRLEETLRLAAVACYANEGIYPPTVAYLQEHYGVQIDTERYAVFYNIFAENLMPDITVIERQAQEQEGRPW